MLKFGHVKHPSSWQVLNVPLKFVNPGGQFFEKPPLSKKKTVTQKEQLVGEVQGVKKVAILMVQKLIQVEVDCCFWIDEVTDYVNQGFY